MLAVLSASILSVRYDALVPHVLSKTNSRPVLPKRSTTSGAYDSRGFKLTVSNGELSAIITPSMSK
jgi:hypothetical protein